MSDLRLTEIMPEDKMFLMRTLFLNKVGVYASDEEITQWAIEKGYHNETPATRGDGGSTSYYELPTNATQLRHLIKHKKMSHPIGEAFCALYRLEDNGERKRNLMKAKFYIECELEDYTDE